MSSKKRVFSCPECGNPYDAFPPDDNHTRVSLKDPKEDAISVIKIVHDCSKCKHPITLYWYNPKLSIAFG
jgi:hypothetical protein